LPRSVLETVLTPRETDLVIMDDPHSSAAYVLHRDSGFSEQDTMPIGLSHSPEPMSPQSGSFITASGNEDLLLEDRESLECALESEAFLALQTKQSEEMRRVAQFELNQRRALLAYYKQSFKHFAAELELTKEIAMKRVSTEATHSDLSQRSLLTLCSTPSNLRN
jgi:hypothetical protein